MEKCIGCGALSQRFGMVGIGPDKNGKMVSSPVCDECWKNPANRKTPLKMHFFDRQHEKAAIRAADDNILAEKP